MKKFDAKVYMREYMRNYRKNKPEKNKEAQEKWWRKKILNELQEQGLLKI